MNPPDELMVKVFLPSIRALVAHRLKARGLSQGKIAKLLDVTQASVHYYLSGGEKEHYERVGLLGFREEEVEGLVGALCEDLMKSEVEGLRTLYSFWIDALAKGRICEAHKRIHPGLKDCDICMTIFSKSWPHALCSFGERSSLVVFRTADQKFPASYPWSPWATKYTAKE